jgi:hypothetical protein
VPADFAGESRSFNEFPRAENVEIATNEKEIRLVMTALVKI